MNFVLTNKLSEAGLCTEYGGIDPHVRIVWQKPPAAKKTGTLRSINARLAAKWPGIVEAAKKNTKRLTGKEAL